MKTLSKVLSPVLAMLIAFSMVVLSSCNKNGSEQERNETPTINEEQAALDAAAAEAARPRAEVTESTARRLQELEKGYTPSDEVAAAREYRDSVAALEPEGYESGFSEKLQALYDQIAGRKAFEYDPEEDEDYQRYAKLYAARGAAAMEDTLGKAAALTGGYGSSYAQTAGQQAYNGYLQELAALVPELRQAALAEYRQEGQALETQYDLLTQQEKNEYQRWQDGRKEWEKLLAAAQDEYESAGDRDQKLYQALLNHFEDKAEQEKKLSSSGVRLVDSGEDGGRGESLSSTAAESLQRAVRNYLKKGNGDLAQALVEKYAQRMTPAQRQRFDALLSGGGQGRLSSPVRKVSYKSTCCEFRKLAISCSKSSCAVCQSRTLRGMALMLAATASHCFCVTFARLLPLGK